MKTSEWETRFDPEFSGNYLVTTKATGTVCMRRYDGSRWIYGKPLAWMWPPAPYSPN